MFTNLLTSLQSLISSRFLVASFFPSLAFWAANVAMACGLNTAFRAWLIGSLNQSTGGAAVLSASALIAAAMFAYLLSAILPGIQSIFEGNWGAWLVSLFAPPQMAALERLEDRIAEMTKLLGTLEGSQTAIGLLQGSLTKARKEGNSKGKNSARNTDELPKRCAHQTPHR